MAPLAAMIASNTSIRSEESPTGAIQGPRAGREAAYDRSFWFTYAANATTMAAISLLFRYADFVKALGGNEWRLGWIVGIGMVGSLLMRVGQGIGIDRFGPRRIWLASSAFFVISCVAHLFVTRLDDPMIVALRIVWQCSVAGFFGASITYITTRAPRGRMAELIGTLGTSGFVGMVAGTSLGDVLLGAHTGGLDDLRTMFLLSAAIGAVGFVFSWLATRGAVPPAPRRRSPVLWQLSRYHPGWVLLVAAATGFALQLPQTFLRPFAASTGIGGIAVFFAFYAPTAFATRLLTRRLPDRIGPRRMMLLGLGLGAGGMLLFPLVRAPWQFVFPALALGAAHAVLFPSIVAGGSAAFPVRYRGTGTTLVLAMFDVGTLMGSPVAGGILHAASATTWPPYTVLFCSVAGLLLLSAAVFAMACRMSPQDQRNQGIRRPTARPRQSRLTASAMPGTAPASACGTAKNGRTLYP